jgi:NADPH2:quinone reductase
VRAVVCEEIGALERLRVVERESAPCGPTQVRVRVRAAGLNFADALVVLGRYQLTPPVPFVPGNELAGEVVEVGADVHAVAVGDRVLASVGLGAFADEAVVEAAQAIRVPDEVTWGQAATLGVVYGTALFALERRTHLEPGETLLVLGAGGGAGLAAIDVAKGCGATVIAAASSAEKLALAREAGADELIDYSVEPLKERARQLTGGGVDVVYDPVGGELAEQALRALGDDGRFLVIGFASGTIPHLPANLVLLRNRRVIGVDWGAWAMGAPSENREVLESALAKTATGILHPVEPFSYPLDRTPAALADLLERRVTGKAVVVP